VNPMAKAFWMGLEHSDGFIRYFTTGMEGDDWLKKPAGIPNPAIWILGHLAHSRASFLELLTGQKRYENGWKDLLWMGAEPRDPAEYPSPDVCWAALDARLADLKAYLDTASEEDLEGPPCTDSKFFKTKAAVLVHLTHHEAHHTGALSMIRRLLGKERLI
jgi:uncharacterized damage-inducible protein DinB